MEKIIRKVLCVVLACLCLFAAAACAPGSNMSGEPEKEESETMSNIEETSAPQEETPYLDGKKLVVFGDSITALGSWGRTAAERLNMRFFNGAMGGITTVQGIARFPAYVASRDADFVTLLFGMNDMIMETRDHPRVTPQEFRENLTTLVRMVRDCGAQPILLTANPLDPSLFWSAVAQKRENYENVGGDPLAWLEVYNDVTRAVAAETETPLVDMFEACRGTAYGVLLRDGIHLAAEGNKIFAETLAEWFETHYEHDPDAEPVGGDIRLRVTKETGRVSLFSNDPSDWFTADPSVLSIQYFSNAMRLANRNGQWPYAECLPEYPLQISVEEGTLYFDLMTRGVSASLILYFGDSTPSAFTEGTYLSLNSALGAEVNEVGDIKPNQTLRGSIRLSDLGIPAQNIQDGEVVLTGIKLYVAGTAYEQVVLRELSVGVE